MLLRDELLTEYNQLRRQASESAKKIIIRCAEILEQLGYPLDKICAKLCDDFESISDRYVQMVLPEKYKRPYSREEESEDLRNLLPRTQLIIALETVVKIAEELGKLASNILHKLMQSRTQLEALDSTIDPDTISSLLRTLQTLQQELDSLGEYTDDRVIITKIEQVAIKLQAQSDSLRHIAQSYHQVKQQDHGPLSAKRVSQIVREG